MEEMILKLWNEKLAIDTDADDIKLHVRAILEKISIAKELQRLCLATAEPIRCTNPDVKAAIHWQQDFRKGYPEYFK